MILENIWTLLFSVLWYMILTLGVPAICLGRYFEKKSLTLKVLFYQCVGNLYVYFTVVLLGYLHIVNFFSLLLVLVILPIGIAGWNSRESIDTYWDKFVLVLNELSMRTYGYKLFWKNIFDAIEKKWSQLYRKYIKKNKLELVLVAAILMWCGYYYGWYKMHYVAYGHGDEETHLYWISSLINGDIFPKGMYPHGMHTLVASISILSGVTVTRVYLMFSVLSTILIFGTIYLVLRKLFKKPYVALMAWGFMTLADIFAPVAYFRFQISFPMEFGMVAVFGMIYAMLSYVEHKDKREIILFSLCIMWTLAIHFYVTILCAVICLCFGVVYIIPLIKEKLLVSFIVAGVCGILLATVPYVVGYVSGYEFERSIAWALNVMETTAETDSANEFEEEDSKAKETEEELSEEEQEIAAARPGIEKFWVQEKNFLAHNYVINKNIAEGMMILNLILFISAAVGMFFKRFRERFRMYVFWTILWEVGALMCCTYYMNLPVLIEVKRMATFLMLLTSPIFGMAIDMLLQVVEVIDKKMFFRRLMPLILVIEMLYLSVNGKNMENLYYTITMSELDMKLCLELVETKDKYTWTVISPVNDLSVIRYDGYHYEIVDLIEELDRGEEEIYMDTPEVYVVLEKKPISFHYDMRKIDHSDIVSLDLVKEITIENALKEVDWDLYTDDIHDKDAAYYYQREILMSKLYYWIEALREVYPHRITVYQEDEMVCIYKIKQDPYFKLNLAIDYQQNLKERVTKE